MDSGVGVYLDATVSLASWTIMNDILINEGNSTSRESVFLQIYWHLNPNLDHNVCIEIKIRQEQFLASGSPLINHNVND